MKIQKILITIPFVIGCRGTFYSEKIEISNNNSHKTYSIENYLTLTIRDKMFSIVNEKGDVIAYGEKTKLKPYIKKTNLGFSYTKKDDTINKKFYFLKEGYDNQQ